MSTRQRIVSYETLNGAFTPYLDRVGQTAAGLESLDALSPEVPTPTAISEITIGLQVLEKEKRNPDVMSGTEDRMSSLIQTYFAQQAPRVVPAASDGLEAKFDSHDLFGWIGSFFTWWKKIHPHSWQPPKASADSIGKRFRVGVFGDWGTGLYGAPVLARAIAADKTGFQVVLHLGDTYYSGETGEIQERLLADWPVVAGALNRSLNGNHEMYTGGHAYFDIALKKFAQTSSCFAFQNDDWLLVGLDTAYADHDICTEEMPWLQSLLAQSGDRRLIFFSHHQPYSLLDVQGPKLIAKLDPYIKSKRIFAWYWGHEHRCVLYDEHPVWAMRGRCIGHGGFPYFRDSGLGAAPAKSAWVRLNSRNLVPGGELLDGRNPYIRGHENEYGPQGYAVLEFDGPHLNELIVDCDGNTIKSQQLVP
jgi:calcineurin-like phosphoesterase family protein